jgi:hypothetical protein
VLILFGDKIRSQTKPFLYLFQLVGAKDPVHESALSHFPFEVPLIRQYEKEPRQHPE